MIRYVALMKFRDETPTDELKQIEERLRVLGKTTGEADSWSCGRCLDSPVSSTPWTFVLVAEFDDEQAYQRYRDHPEHQAFRELIRPYREKSVAMSYQANYPGLWWVRHEGGVPIPIPPPEHRLPPLEGSTCSP